MNNNHLQLINWHSIIIVAMWVSAAVANLSVAFVSALIGTGLVLWNHSVINKN